MQVASRVAVTLVLLGTAFVSRPSQAQTVESEDRLALATVTVGTSIRTRNAHISSVPRRGYDTFAYPELAFSVRSRPFVTTVGMGNLARGFFADLGFAHSAGLTSQAMGNAIATTNFLRLELDVGWLGPATDTLEVGVGLGFVFDGYYLTDGAVFPAVEYAALRPGLRARYRLMGETFVVGAQLAYRGALAVGGLDAFSSGWEAHGFDVGVSLGGHFTEEWGVGLAWRAQLGWTSWFLSSATAGGADHSARFDLLIGWAF